VSAVLLSIVPHATLQRYNAAVPWTSHKVLLHVFAYSTCLRVYIATSTMLNIDQHAHWPDHISDARRPSRYRLAHEHLFTSPAPLSYPA
jgi:hypothetical protein